MYTDAQRILPRPDLNVGLASQEISLTNFISKNINIYLWYIINIIIESIFIINLFEDKNITRIFYESSQTSTKTQNCWNVIGSANPEIFKR